MNKNVSMEQKIDLKRAERIRTAPVSCRGALARAYSKTCSPRAAIKAFCLECVGFDRAAITECAAYACPVWNFRPFKNKTT